MAGYALDGPYRLALQSADGNTVLRYIRPAAPLPATGAENRTSALLLLSIACLMAGVAVRRLKARRN